MLKRRKLAAALEDFETCIEWVAKTIQELLTIADVRHDSSFALRLPPFRGHFAWEIALPASRMLTILEPTGHTFQWPSKFHVLHRPRHEPRITQPYLHASMAGKVNYFPGDS